MKQFLAPYLFPLIYYFYNDIGYGDLEQFFKHTWS